MERMQPCIYNGSVQQLLLGKQLVIDQDSALGGYVPQLVVQGGDSCIHCGEAGDHGHGGGDEGHDFPMNFDNIIGQDLRADAAFTKGQMALIGPEQGSAEEPDVLQHLGLRQQPVQGALMLQPAEQVVGLDFHQFGLDL